MGMWLNLYASSEECSSKDNDFDYSFNYFGKEKSGFENAF